MAQDLSPTFSPTLECHSDPASLAAFGESRRPPDGFWRFMRDGEEVGKFEMDLRCTNQHFPSEEPTYQH